MAAIGHDTAGAGIGTKLAIAAVVAAIAVGAPYALYPVFLMKLLCFALFACAFNLLIGFVGLLSFGHAAFFGSAAYVTAHAAKVWGWPPELAILAGTAAAAALGFLIGIVAIRRQGIYFAMITLALSYIVFFAARKAPFTGGEDGITAVPQGRMFGVLDLSDPMVFYYVVLAIFGLGFFIIWRIVHSPFGQILKAIRENEPRAISLGYRVDAYKLSAFIMSAALAGLAGGTKSLVLQLAALPDIQWQMSGEVILMTLLGGIGTLVGPVVGAGVVVTLQNYLAESGLPIPVVIGTIFVVVVLLFRRGIVGEIAHLLRKWG